MTTEEIRELIADIGVKISETAEIQRRNGEDLKQMSLAADRRFRQTEQVIEQTALELKSSGKETDRRLAELGRQLGGLGEKFGSFTEGMALPSMTRLLQERFHMDVVSPRVLSRLNGHLMELDVLAYSNRAEVNEAYVVEIKSHLRQDGLEQMKKTLRELRHFFPFLAGKKVYGILAVVDAPEKLRQKVYQEGIYLARIHDEEFELDVPDRFKPRAF